MDKRRAGGLAKAGLAVVAWGASFVATKVALREASPVTVIWIRFALGVAVLGATVQARRELARISRTELAHFALLGFIGITFHQWLQANGLLTAKVGTSSWVVSTSPAFIAILARLALREELSRQQVAGIALAAGGVVLVISEGDLGALAAGHKGSPGDILFLASAANWAVFSVLARHGLKRHPPARMIFYVVGLGWMMTTPAFLAGPHAGEIARLTARGWAAIAFLGVACSGLAYICWFDALEALPASQVGSFLYVEPLVTAAVAALVIAEPLHPAVLGGGGIILAGVWIVNRRPPPRASGPRPQR